MSPTVPASNVDLNLTQRLAEQIAVERVRHGDAFALEMIFTAYRAELLEMAQRILGGHEVAEEVVQDVFLAIWAGRARWRITTSLRAYLRRAVHNVAVRSGASRSRGGALGIELSAAERAMPGALTDASGVRDAGLERAEFAAALDQAVRNLPPRPREVFTLRHVEELSNREIATRLGLSIKTVEIHMTRALAALRRQLAAWRR